PAKPVSKTPARGNRKAQARARPLFRFRLQYRLSPVLLCPKKDPTIQVACEQRGKLSLLFGERSRCLRRNRCRRCWSVDERIRFQELKRSATCLVVTSSRVFAPAVVSRLRQNALVRKDLQTAASVSG